MRSGNLAPGPGFPFFINWGHSLMGVIFFWICASAEAVVGWKHLGAKSAQIGHPPFFGLCKERPSLVAEGVSCVLLFSVTCCSLLCSLRAILIGPTFCLAAKRGRQMVNPRPKAPHQLFPTMSFDQTTCAMVKLSNTSVVVLVGLMYPAPVFATGLPGAPAAPASWMHARAVSVAIKGRGSFSESRTPSGVWFPFGFRLQSCNKGTPILRTIPAMAL